MGLEERERENDAMLCSVDKLIMHERTCSAVNAFSRLNLVDSEIDCCGREIILLASPWGRLSNASRLLESLLQHESTQT